MSRTSGILLHPTSLPGPYGIGDLGPGAYRFVDFLAAAGQGLWQMLPLGPTGYGDSPYQCLSAFAGNPLLISPELLLEDGWLDVADLDPPATVPDQVEFGPVREWKSALLAVAHRRFLERASPGDSAALAAFCRDQAHWLDGYALFAALKASQDLRPWTEWPAGLSRRDPQALAEWSQAQAEAIQLQYFEQFVFARQWQRLRAYAGARGVRLVGDAPIFVAHDSSEVWTHPEWFYLDDGGVPTVVAGVPPDFFSKTGQRWGNPLYRWDALRARNYDWWIARFRQALALVDAVRIDHFRGFAANWEIPAAEPTAVKGRWVPGPGADLFHAVRAALGALPIVAEDLGVITPDVEALRDGLGLPGMKVLQFAWSDPRNPFLPHAHVPNAVVYSGTHDNNTTVGWWLEDASEEERGLFRRYTGSDGREVNWDMIRLALASVADLAVIPHQDLVGLGGDCRMNNPSEANGNWRFRITPWMPEETVRDRLAEALWVYDRRRAPEAVTGEENTHQTTAEP